MLAGLASGDVLDDLFDDDDLLLYVAIGFLCFAVLFLFVVILFISIAVIRLKKILWAREYDVHYRNGEVISNSHAMSGRSLNSATNWSHFFPESRNGRESNSNLNLEYQDYMDLIIMDASRVSLPRARLDSEKTTF